MNQEQELIKQTYKEYLEEKGYTVMKKQKKYKHMNIQDIKIPEYIQEPMIITITQHIKPYIAHCIQTIIENSETYGNNPQKLDETITTYAKRITVESLTKQREKNEN